MITVITGPPCSGKTTYVREHAKPGDVIIDFDALAVALGGTASHDHSDLLRGVTGAAWIAAIRRAIDLGADAWIIDARPKADRRGWYDGVGAAYVRLDADPAELHHRADEDGRPATCHQRIDDWFNPARYDPPPMIRTRW